MSIVKPPEAITNAAVVAFTNYALYPETRRDRPEDYEAYAAWVTYLRLHGDTELGKAEEMLRIWRAELAAAV